MMMDEKDRMICDALQSNGRMHFSELSERIGLSQPAIAERVRKLEEKGIISGWRAILAPEHFELDILAFVFVRVEGSAHYPHFIEQCKGRPEIMECHAITGEASHLLKVRTKNTRSLEHLLSELQQWPGVKRTMTNFTLSSPFERNSIDVWGSTADDK